MNPLVVNSSSGVRLGEPERALLATAEAQLVERHCPTEEALLEHAGEANAVLTLDEPFSARVLAAMPHLRVISRFGVGVDRIDLEVAHARGIVVANVPDYCVDEASDHALALLLAVSRRLLPLHRSVVTGGWETQDVARDVRRLRGQVLGLVGFGRIGQRLAEKAAALGLQVWAHDPYVPAETMIVLGVRPADFRTLLASSDILSLHAALTPETHHLLDGETLRLLKRGAVLINVARGGLVEEGALVGALREGHLAGAGLDVFELEPPPPDHPLLGLPNVVLTSHAAFYSQEAVAEQRLRAVDNVVRVLDGRPPHHSIAARRPTV